jgi:transcription antitermination factor NusG
MENFRECWCVLYTKPKHEKKVDDQLRKMNLNSYLPTIKTLKTWCDRKKYVEVPLFPSYVFVRIADFQQYYNSLKIASVLNYVKVGNRIAKVSESIINDIRSIVVNGNDVEISSEHFMNGTDLIIKEGPFAGFKCECIQYRGKKKLLVRINDLRQNILLNVPADILRNVSTEQLAVSAH